MIIIRSHSVFSRAVVHINNKETVEFIATLFAQAYAHEDGYKFNEETEFDRGWTISDIIEEDCILERTILRVKRGMKYNNDGTVTVNLWKDLNHEDNKL